MRMALGATRGERRPADSRRRRMRPVAVGAAIGVAGRPGGEPGDRRASSSASSRTDPLTIAAVVPTLIGVALVASAVPARRAAAVDPTRALQSE